MDPNQQQLLLTGGAKDKVYIDEVFNTQAYIGNATERTITTGIDLAGEGGLLWFKNRDNSNQANYLNDTTALPQTASPWYSYPMFSNSNTQRGASANGLKSFNSDGFTIQTDNHCNGNGDRQVAWSFRKAPAFFDIVQYDGDSTTRDIPHNLGCVPGMIIIKRTDQAGHWWVYHKNLGRATADWAKVCRLNETDAQQDAYCLGATSHQNATTFRVGNDNSMNTTGGEYVAYLFAGGESKTAYSVDFDGSGDYLTTNSSSDYTPGTSDFTLEYWYNPDENAVDFIVDAAAGSEVWATYCNAQGTHKYRTDGSDRIVSTSKLRPGQWYHIAVVRISNIVKMYINGEQEGVTYTDTNNYTFNQLNIGRRTTNDYQFNGKISNLRFVVGTGIYTSAFRVPTSPLTSITNTKLLCCNSSTVTGATTGTVTSSGDPAASTVSPFLDPEGFQFGGEGDSNVVHCGSYMGDTSTSPEIYIGWEPQLIIFKQKYDSGNWSMFDSMRGIITNGDEHYLYPNLENSEYTAERISLTSTGFLVDTGAGTLINTNDQEYIYIAIRRSDGAVGKPAEAGTNVFTMDSGAGSSTIPNFDSTFPVDYALNNQYAAANNPMYSSARLTGGDYLQTNDAGGPGNDAGYSWDSNIGWGSGSYFSSARLSWMWKRHAGFDVVTYKGKSPETEFAHSLNKVPEMMWVKRRNSGSWQVYHEGLNSGTNPQDYYLELNQTYGIDTGTRWNNTAPTSTHFSLGPVDTVNGALSNSYNYIAMLFATVDGISKCGYYDGQATTHDITTGFAPRMVIIKEYSAAGQSWWLLDTVRGWSAGNDQGKQLQSTNQQISHDFGAPTATGFTLVGGHDGSSNAGKKYIYYAHA